MPQSHVFGREGQFVRGRLTVSLVAAFSVAALLFPSPVGAGDDDGLGEPREFVTDAAGDNGRGRIERGETCAEGGDGGYWHYDYEADLAPGVITGPDSELPGDLRIHLDLHADEHQIRSTPEPGSVPAEPSAWLLEDASHASLANQRGTVRLGLSSGTNCDGKTLTFDGENAQGSGGWEITSSSGSYREATGAGLFTIDADVRPGADNPWSLDLGGDIAVLQPDLDVEVTETYWGFLGAHYLIRWVSVVYEVTNVGPGDAFDVRLTDATSPTPGLALVGPIHGVHNLGPTPQSLGDLAAGESERIVLRWQLPLPAGNPPCELVILGCEFDSTLTFSVPDALDVASTQVETVHAAAPDLPPPL